MLIAALHQAISDLWSITNLSPRELSKATLDLHRPKDLCDNEFLARKLNIVNSTSKTQFSMINLAIAILGRSKNNQENSREFQAFHFDKFSDAALASRR
jgi:hypothetical protein